MLEIRDLTKRYGDVVALDGAVVQGRAGSDRRVPRAERGGQDHHHADDLRTGTSRSGRGALERKVRRARGASTLRLRLSGQSDPWRLVGLTALFIVANELAKRRFPPAD
jgi:hypothetical protein